MIRIVKAITLPLTLLLLILAFTVGIAHSQTPNGEYDADGDRLIEISNLEQLNAVRYDLSNGNGRPDDSDDARAYRAAFPTSAGESVCDRACRGYELTSSLDFNSPDSYSAGAVDPEWNGGDGWLPINDNRSGLNAEFEGNGHTISNLYIHRRATVSVGLFARVGGSGIIRNTRVVNAEMEGRSYTGILAGSNSGTITASYATGSVSGRDNYVGGLVGDNSSGGAITASYATGSVSGDNYVGGLVGANSSGITASYATGSVSGRATYVGGLVGYNRSGGAITASYATGSASGIDDVGGLVGENSGAITASYATGSVSGRDNYVGGLVGDNSSSGAITASYATGSVSGNYAGGLVGYNSSGGAIIASYATGSVSGDNQVGGLVGLNQGGAITDSYWNTDIFGAGTDGEGRTTAQLQSPTGYTGIYRDWNADLDNADGDDDDATGADDFWDFGTSSQYPALKVDFDGDGDATAAEFGGQHGDAPAPMPLVFIEGANGEYDADGDRLIEISNLEQLNAVRYDLSNGNGRPDDSDDARAYRAAFPTSAGESVCDRACRGYELTSSLDFNSPDSYSAGAVDPEWNGGDGWLPINDNRSGLNAEFEGNGHTISNLYIHRRATVSVGLFARVGGSGIIRNTRVVNAEMEGRSYTGILAGSNSGTITASYATGSVSGRDNYVGGLVGDNSSGGAITASYATGSVSGDNYVGGLVGANSSGITASYATGSVSGRATYVGGLVGYNRSGGAITASYATGSASGIDDVGGLVGENSGAITASYATGSVSGRDNYVGGLVGDNSSSGAITASYATGSVSGNYAGGLVGYNSSGGAIIASYATGSVSGDNQVGGLVGLNQGGAITDSYWNTDIFGAGTDGEGRTTAQLQSPTGYTGIYRDWNADLDNADRNDDDATGADDFWDFGTSSQYPALKVDFDGDGDATAAEFGGQHGDAPAPMPLVFIEGANGEYDADGDRLIEISNLEQLNAVRYDLSNGNGRPDDSDDARAYRAAFPTSAGESVCDRACRGYELTSSLDFNSPDSYSAGAVDPEWNGGDGWLPINDNRSGLNAEFEGNGHTISNLYIHRRATVSVGLFARVGGSGIIRNTRVVNAEMEGRSYTGILAGSNSGTITASYATGSVSGRDNYVGGLVGDNSSGGAITASYATGSVSGDNYVGGLVGANSSGITASYATGSVSGRATYVGGLVGYNRSGGAITASYATGSASGIDDVGGLVGENSGAITASYATGSVSGRDNYVGGLVGDNSSSGAITASYATGSVSGNYAGGLVGYNSSGGAIIASYATGSVSGDNQVGGLVGLNQGGAITDSYWNTDIFGAGTDGEGRTTAQLQSPTGYTGIYRDWNADLDNADGDDDDATGADDFWDFGTSSQYPALKVDFDGDGDATAAEFGGQHGDAPAPMPLVFIEGANGEYDADGDRLIEISNLEQLNAVRYDLSNGNGRPDDSDDARAYRAAFPTSAGESVCDRACRGYELTSSLDFNSPDSYSAGAVDPEWNGGDGWLPINDNRSGLNAEFEGNGHTISNLYIHRRATVSVGLFARVGGSGIIRNTRVVNAEMEGRSYTGILAGSNSGTITASYATGSVSGRDNYVGGLVGDNSSGGAITASYATGSVSGDNYVGGLVGANSSGITASYATGSVSGRATYVGGLVGYNRSGGAITASYATGSASGIDDVGGLVGENSGAITASYATGSVSGRDNYVGGLVGDNSSSGAITASYATGSVSGNYAGGLVGYNSSGGAIIASYATGSVSGDNQVGGLVGLNQGGAITDSYWNTDIFGAGTDGEGRTTAQLQSPTGYTGIYRDWNADLDNADRNDDDATGADDFWDFGTSSQYPALKVDFDGDGDATAAEFGGQGRAVPAPPVFTEGASATRSVAENTAAGENIGDPVAATDPDNDTLTYTLGAADAESFDIEESSGQLQTKAALDYETKTSYTVEVTATDPSGAGTTITVTVTVTDVDLGTLGNRYDADRDEAISKEEAITAIREYFSDGITKAEAIEIIRLYFSSS